MGLVLQPVTTQDRIAAGPGFYTKPLEEGAETGGFLAAAGASFVEENAIAQWIADAEFDSEAETLDGYDQYRDIPDDLSDMPLEVWRGVRSPDQMQARIGEIYAERERRRVAATNGWGSFVGAMGGYLLSPETIPELLLTQGRSGLTGAVRVGLGALSVETAHEIAMHSTSYTRTWQESMTNVGLTAFAGAGLGALAGSRAKKKWVRETTDDLHEIVSPGALKDTPEDARSIGAAQLATEGEEIVNKPWLKWGWLAPVRPLAHATANTARKLFNDVVEHSYRPAKTDEGKAKQLALETRVNREIATVVRRANEALLGNYKKWAAEDDIGAIGRLRPKNWAEYQRQVHRALVDGDYAASPHVKNAAQQLRNEYDRIYRVAGEARIRNPKAAEEFMSLEEFQVKFADGYAPRRYNRKLLRTPKEAQAFKQALREGFIKEREQTAFQEAQEAAEKAGETFTQTIEDFRVHREDAEVISEIDSQVDATYDRIANSYDLDVYIPPVQRGAGDPFKDRKVPLSDADMLARGWLESDMQAMMMNYTNRVLKPSRMILEVGDTEMKGAMQAMNDEYAAMLRKLEGKDKRKQKQYKKLDKEQQAVRQAMETWRDRWYGRSTISSNRAAEAVNDTLRTLRNLNVARMMGMVTLISAGDVFRANLTTIFAPELGKMGPGFIDAVKTVRAARKSGRWLHQIGVAHEMASYVRTGKILDDSGLLEGTSDAVRYSQAASKGLMRVTGLGYWTDWMKELAAAYTQNDLMQKMRGYARLSDKSKAKLANLGVNETMANALQKEIASGSDAIKVLGREVHGYEGNGYVIDFDGMNDQVLAGQLKDIIFRESERNIVTPGAGEIPAVFGNDEINKTVFQFQSFLFGAAHSVTVNLGQRLRMKDPKAIMIMANMMVGGMAAVALRNAAYGGERFEEMGDWSGQDWVLNAMDYSSITPIFMMGFNYANVMTGNGLVNAIGAESMTRYAHRPLGSLLGPTLGTGEDLMMATRSVASLPFGEEMTASDIRRLRRLLPYNNLAYTARLATQAQETLEP